ncbi:hypothetical protein THAOC_34736 [Thalassiosira oceanica]|uniref:Uncharacterized protein n=1 Tax=Thalassiosira oceanica TaxID=159749 RepID=K0R4J1_THAOC|nr:hypothetical protein THAOC_34736 [Thalassiosira oceanica]|eukprot:EJK46589.1 hypothetical protein THAOC_34736 [Thalassiosira oceanica]
MLQLSDSRRACVATGAAGAASAVRASLRVSGRAGRDQQVKWTRVRTVLSKLTSRYKTSAHLLTAFYVTAPFQWELRNCDTDENRQDTRRKLRRVSATQLKTHNTFTGERDEGI